jgi:hypothetical protein
LLALGLVLVALVLYGGTLSYPFSRDDVAHFSDRQRWQGDLGESLSLFQRPFWEERGAGLYRPMTTFSLQRTIAAFGFQPFALRLGNVLLHFAVAWLIALWAHRLGLSRGASILLALATAVHPLTTEPVLEVVSRSETLSLGFLLLALHCGLQSSWGGLLLAALFALAAFLSKESSLALSPLLAVVLVVRRHSGSRATSLAVLVLLVLGYFLLRRSLLGSFLGLTAIDIDVLDNPLAGESHAVRVFSACAIFGRYLLLWLWPLPLSADYSLATLPVIESWFDGRCLAGLVAALVLLVWGIQAYRRRSWAELCGLSLALLAFLPVANLLFPIGTIMAERLFYMPSIGLLMAVAAWLDQRYRLLRKDQTRSLRTAAWMLATVLLLLWGTRSTFRARDWSSKEALYAAALKVVPTSARVHCIVGFHRASAEQYEPAAEQLRLALEIHPQYQLAHRALGSCLAQLGDLQGAFQHFREAALHPQADREDILRYGRLLVKRGLSSAELERVRPALLKLLQRNSGDTQAARLLRQLEDHH